MTECCSVHDLATLDPDRRSALFRRAVPDLAPFMDRARSIVRAVEEEGDAALVRFAREFEGADLAEADIRVADREFDAALGAVAPDVVDAIAYAVANARAFHEAQRPGPMWLKEIRPGAFAGDRWTPIPSVALYVPRGKGAFPSVTLMASVPAVIAGVRDIAICTPPTAEGGVDAATLVAARLSGVSTVYKCGGAQAVAAVAHGTRTVAPARKIVGPGSPWVVAAKRLLAGVIDTGLPAGPSEVIVFADGSVDGRLAALDVLIEAEHGPDSSAYVVTHSRAVAEAVLAALPGLWAEMSPQRASFSKAVLCGPHGGVVLTRSLAESYDFVNAYAPEHLEILSSQPFEHLGALTEAAEILLGPRTPVTLANFVLGMNNVLPTGGWARTCGPLSVTDFMKRSSVGHVTAGAYPELAGHAGRLARYEGFDAHANAVSGMRDPLPG